MNIRQSLALRLLFLATLAIVASSGSIYAGDPVGACCLPDGAPCLITTEANCRASGGDYLGDSVPCDPDPCPATGACCFSDGSCTRLSEEECASAGGLFAGNGIACFEAFCFELPGACCTENGCRIEFAGSCSGEHFPGTPCDPDPCGATPLVEGSWGTLKAVYR